MDSRLKKILIAAGIVLAVLLIIGIVLRVIEHNKQNDSSWNEAEIINTTNQYLINHGTYSYDMDPEKYLDSYLQFEVPDKEKSRDDITGCCGGDEETKDYERSIKYSTKTTILTTSISYIDSTKYNKAETISRIKKDINSDEGSSVLEIEMITYLEKVGGVWYIKRTKPTQEQKEKLQSEIKEEYVY